MLTQTDKTICELPENTRQIVIEALEYAIKTSPNKALVKRARAALLVVQATQGELPW